MFSRFSTFLGVQLLTGVLGGYLGASLHMDHGAFIGVIFGATLWFLWDVSRAQNLLQLLRADASAALDPIGGIWGEIAGRVRRLLRDKDITISNAENRLQDFLSALQASPNGVVLLDSSSRIEWCNQTAALHFGLDSQRDMLQIIGNLVRDPAFAHYLSDRNFGSELLMPGRNSTVSRPVKLSVQLHPYGGGRLLLLSRDVTALEQAEAMRRDFVANVSHEIRTPLTVLAGFVETLQTLEVTTDEKDHYLELMAVQADRMQTLVRDLLMLSRLEGSPAPSVEAWTSVPDLLHDLAQDAQALVQVLGAQSSHIHQLVFDNGFEGELAGVETELLSAMGNLISNAIRYTPVGGEVTVKTSVLPDGRVAFSVLDTGPGISPEHLPRLTERFYRVDRSRSRETGGTGLGLAIVKHVAQRHGAELTIESTLGAGSCFKMIFPVLRLRGVHLPLPNPADKSAPIPAQIAARR